MHRLPVDRFLLGIRQTSARPVICINKYDLLNDENKEDLERLSVYRDLDVDIFYCSAEEGTGITELISGLEDTTCVFLGTSGVGKSSLLNAIDPSLDLKTQENRYKAAGRGRHTTVMAHMYQVGKNIKFIDTPGVREFNFLDLEPAEVQYGFDEFQKFLPCKFNNCLHIQEKGCSIMAAVEEGKLSEMRYESYKKIVQTLEVKRLPHKQRDNLLF